MKKINRLITTFEREMKDAKFKATFDRKFQEFALQELISAMAEGDTKSVRALAKEAGLRLEINPFAF